MLECAYCPRQPRAHPSAHILPPGDQRPSALPSSSPQIVPGRCGRAWWQLTSWHLSPLLPHHAPSTPSPPPSATSHPSNFLAPPQRANWSPGPISAIPYPAHHQGRQSPQAASTDNKAMASGFTFQVFSASPCLSWLTWKLG